MPDLDAAIRRAEDAGATLEARPDAAAWGRLALMADPFGHGFCLIKFSARGYDAIAKDSASAEPGAAGEPPGRP